VDAQVGLAQVLVRGPGVVLGRTVVPAVLPVVSFGLDVTFRLRWRPGVPIDVALDRPSRTHVFYRSGLFLHLSGVPRTVLVMVVLRQTVLEVQLGVVAVRVLLPSRSRVVLGRTVLDRSWLDLGQSGLQIVVSVRSYPVIALLVEGVVTRERILFETVLSIWKHLPP
jgi:hypothetical protein